MAAARAVIAVPRQRRSRGGEGSGLQEAETATLDVLRAIAVGKGPREAVLALGYAGWAAGQLETEIQANGWLNCPADAALLFDAGLTDKYGRALRKIGIDPIMLSGQAGHA